MSTRVLTHSFREGVAMALQLSVSNETGPARVDRPPRSGEAKPTGAPLRLDRIDRRIVNELQADATLPLARLADRVGLSQTPCWKRIQKLEQAGVITRRVALVDPAKVSLGLTAFVAVSAADHGPDWRDSFHRVTAAMPEILEIWRVVGEADYLLKVVVRDLAAFDAFYGRLTASIALKSVSSQLALERVAHTTALPVPPDES